MKLSPLAAIVGLALATGCGRADEEPAPPDPDAPAPAFTADPEAVGAQLWLEAAPSGSSYRVTLWGRDLGPVLGWSAHLAYDPEHLVLESGGAADDAMGSPDEVVTLVQPRSDALALAATRDAASRGDVVLDDPVMLGSATFAAPQAATSRLELRAVVLRRADGGYVDVTLRGGELDTLQGVQGDTGGAP